MYTDSGVEAEGRGGGEVEKKKGPKNGEEGGINETRKKGSGRSREQKKREFKKMKKGEKHP